MQANIEKLLKSDFPRLTAAQIQFFYDAGWIQRVINQQEDYNWLALKVRQYLASIGQKPQLESAVRFVAIKKAGKRITRDDARSSLLAYVAKQETEVVGFRKQQLKDKLIEFSHLEAWLKQVFEKDWRGQPAKREAEQKPVFLEYAVPTDNWLRRMPVAPGGVLERIKRIADGLSAKFGYRKAEGVVFLLCGLEPWAPSMRAEIVNDKSIVLTINPAVTSHEVARFYRDIKKQMKINRRIKNLTDKHLRLAILACEREKTGKQWSVALKEWNKAAKQKRDRYSQESNFRRDALKARERLMSL